MKRAGLALMLLGLLACGDDSPTPEPGRLSSISIAPRTDWLRVGQTETYGATLTGGTATASWRSDNPAVLSIDDGGRARGVTNGRATITASAQGLSDTLLIRVVPDYQGAWSGDGSIRACDASGDVRNIGFCDPDLFARGALLAVGFNFSQNRDQVTGEMISDIRGPATGTIDADGRFSGSATIAGASEGISISVNVPTLKLNAEGNRLSGEFVAVFTVSGLQGTGYLEVDLRTVARAASGLRPTTGSGRPSWASRLATLARRQ